MNENELMHYGVLGMKWGVHRANKLSSKAAGSVSRSKELKKQNRKRKKKLFGSDRAVDFVSSMESENRIRPIKRLLLTPLLLFSYRLRL